MRRYELSAPINNAIPGGGYRSGIIDILEHNYSVARNDSYTLVQRYRRTAADESVADLGRSKVILAEWSIDDDVLAGYAEIQRAGTKVFLSHTEILDAIEVALTNGLEGLLCTSDDQVTAVRAAGLKALINHAVNGPTAGDYCEVSVTSVVDEASAAALIAETDGKGTLIAMGDYSESPDITYAKAMAIGAEYFGSVDEFGVSPQWYAPKIFMGTSIVSFDEIDTDWYFKTDIGTVITDASGSKWLVRNELGRAVEHYIVSDVDVKVETSSDAQDIIDGRVQPMDYSNEMLLDRYVRFSSPAEDVDSKFRVLISNDIDTINHSTTYYMLEPLPGWMAWRTDESSVAWRFTNAIGAIVDELKNFPTNVILSGASDFPAAEVNGLGKKEHVGPDYWPTTELPQAQDVKQLLMSSQPCFCIIDEWTVSVRAVPPTDNLWTPLDEWGLIFDLDRHEGETLVRFQKRILDVMSHKIGASLEGIKAAAVRELSPNEDFEGYNGSESISVMSLDDPSLMESDGMPGDLINKAVDDQRKHGVHTWDNGVIGASVWNADGTDHIGGDHLPNRFDTPLSTFPARMIASGSGPDQDMAIIKKEDTDNSTTVTLTKKWLELQDQNAVHPAVVKFNTWVEGTYTKVDRSLVHYRIKVKIRRTSDNKEFYHYIEESAQSNLDLNLRTHNTFVEDHRLFSTQGYPLGVWNEVVGDKPVLRVNLPKLSEINQITAEVIGIKTVLNGVLTTRVVTAQQGNERYVRMTLESTPDPEAAIWVNSGTVITKANPTSSHHSLFIQVAPFTGDGSSSTEAWESRRATQEVTVNDGMSNGAYVVTNKVVDFPNIYTPTYIAAKTYNKEIVSISFPLRLDASAAEIATALASATLTFDDNNNPTTITIAACAGGEDPVVKLPTLSTDSDAIPSDYLAIGETQKISISDFTINEPVGTAINEIYSVSVEPGFLASVDPTAGVVSVTRERVPADSELLVNPGFHWLSDTEDYFYTSKVTTAVPVDATSVELANYPADFSLVKASPFIYRYAVDQDGEKTFSVTESIISNGTTTLTIPDSDVTLIEVSTDGVPTGYSGIVGNVITLDAAPDAGTRILVRYSLNSSFYVDGKIVYLSAANGVANIEWQEPVSGAVTSSVNIDPLMTWNRRFFVGYESALDTSVKNIRFINSQPMTAGASESSLHDWIMVAVEVTDANGNPIPGEMVVFESDPGASLLSDGITNDEGIATAYFSGEGYNGTSALLFASVEGADAISVSILVDWISAEIDWIMVTDHPSTVKSGSEALVAWRQVPLDGVALTKTTYRIDYIPFADNGTLTTNATVDTDSDTYALTNLDADGNLVWTQVIGNTNVTSSSSMFSYEITAQSRTGAALGTGLYKMTITAKTAADLARKTKTIMWRVY